MRLNTWAKSRGITLKEAKELTGISHHNKEVPEKFLKPGDGMPVEEVSKPQEVVVETQMEPFVPEPKPDPKVVVAPPIEEKKKAEKPRENVIRANGEVVRYAADGKDYGANLINRMKGK